MTKTQKIALLMAFHTDIPVSEDSLLTMISWVINGIDDDRIEWSGYINYAMEAGAAEDDGDE